MSNLQLCIYKKYIKKNSFWIWIFWCFANPNLCKSLFYVQHSLTLICRHHKREASRQNKRLKQQTWWWSVKSFASTIMGGKQSNAMQWYICVCSSQWSMTGWDCANFRKKKKEKNWSRKIVEINM